MRTLLTTLLLMTFLLTKAQSHLPINTFNPYPFLNIGNSNYKWQLKPYANVSVGYIFLNGGISYMTAPVGLMLVHPLNKNVSAFGGVSIAPTFFSVSQLYSPYSGNGFSNRYGLGINGRVEGGLIYTNDAKTFSISGRVGVERGSYPVYPVYNTNTKRQ